MAKKVQQRDKTEAVGMFVYHTPKYKNVYYDIFTGKAYAIFNSEISRFNIHNSKGILALLVGFACNFYLKLDALLCVAIAFGIYVLGIISFRLTVLKKLTPIDDFVRPSDNYIDSIVDNYSLTKLIVMNLLLIAFVALCIINIRNEGYSGSNLILNYGLAGIAIVLFVLFGIALIKKIKKL